MGLWDVDVFMGGVDNVSLKIGVKYGKINAKIIEIWLGVRTVWPLVHGLVGCGCLHGWCG